MSQSYVADLFGGVSCFFLEVPSSVLVLLMGFFPESSNYGNPRCVRGDGKDHVSICFPGFPKQLQAANPRRVKIPRPGIQLL